MHKNYYLRTHVDPRSLSGCLTLPGPARRAREVGPSLPTHLPSRPSLQRPRLSISGAKQGDALLVVATSPSKVEGMIKLLGEYNQFQSQFCETLLTPYS